jgi:hypothetical protein
VELLFSSNRTLSKNFADYPTSGMLLQEYNTHGSNSHYEKTLSADGADLADF